MSRRRELEASWARTCAHLERAFGHLPPSPVDGEEGGSLKRYREWIDPNELGLALDELEMLGESNGVSPAFWKCLLEAANEMKLTDRAVRYQKKIVD